ncbi:MAG: hypothetical protein KAW13_00720 [Dehalococcoidia bacterium]|nr:hypothetical protein [Dehalococcoidia bacterium]
MKVICEEQTVREISESMIPSQSDDAWHPIEDPNYIEWWYFDIMNIDGSLVRGQFYISGDVSRPRKVRTGVRASYVRPDGTELLIDEKLPYSSFTSSTEVCAVEIGKNFIRGDISHCELHIENGEKSLDLKLDAGIEGIKSHACFGDETKCMYWVVPQPRGQARGTFRTRGETLDIKGLGYRDHNWLNFSPLDVIAYWDWGRVYDEEYTIIFADIVTSKKFDNARIKPLIIYDTGKLLYMTSETNKWSLSKTDIKFDPVAQMELPQTHLVKLKDEDLSLEMDLQLEKIFQKIDPLADFNPLVRFLIRTFKAKPSIISLYSVGSGTLNLAGRENALTCKAVHELVRNF